MDIQERAVAAASLRWTIVDPGAEVARPAGAAGPDAGDLHGKVVGFRVDVLWRSWDWVADEWQRALEGAGVRTLLWRRFQDLDGEQGEQQSAGFAEFLDSIDVAVVGLGNCGSCTSWTIKDAVSAIDRGLPTIAATTAVFEQLGHTLARLYGQPGLRIHRLPYPLDNRPEAEVREIARTCFPSMLAGLGAVL